MKRLFLISLVFGLLFFSLPAISFCQSSKEAIRALKKLQAKIEIGIPYNDFCVALGDAKFKVDAFLESSEAKQKVKLASLIEKSLNHYVYAKSIWDLAIKGFKSISINPNEKTDDYYKKNNLFIPSLLNAYPIIKTKARKSEYSGENICIRIEEVRQIVLAEAKENMKMASALFQNAGKK